MIDQVKSDKSPSLIEYGITHQNIHYQLSPEQLHEITIDKGMGKESSLGSYT